MRKRIKIGDKFKVQTCKGLFTAEFIDFEVPTIKLETGEVYTGKFRHSSGSNVYRLDVEGQNTPITLLGNFKCWRLTYEEGIWDEMFCTDAIHKEKWYLSKKIAKQDYDAIYRTFSFLEDAPDTCVEISETYFFHTPNGFVWRRKDKEGDYLSDETFKREVSVEFMEFND